MSRKRVISFTLKVWTPLLDRQSVLYCVCSPSSKCGFVKIHLDQVIVEEFGDTSITKNKRVDGGSSRRRLIGLVRGVFCNLVLDGMTSCTNEGSVLWKI